jgi:hypothetical protein
MGRHSAAPVASARIGRTYAEGDTPWPGRLFGAGVLIVAAAGIVAVALIWAQLNAPIAVWVP